MTNRAEPTRDPDTELADLADKLLKGEAVDLPPESENDLRPLEETVRRLHRAFPPDWPDEKTRDRLEGEFRQRTRQGQQSAARTGWLSNQGRQRLVVAFAAVLILLVIALPILLPGTTGNLQGAALSGLQDVVLLIVFAGVLIFLIWQGRRK